MILKLSKDKKLTFYRKNPIYIGEKDFDTIEVLIPLIVDNNETNNLNFILHLVNKNGEYLHINLDKEIKGDIVVGSTKISSTITNEAQNFFLYLELIKENNEIIGKTNCVEITIEPLPDEDTRITPKEEYEEIIDELTEIIQENTEAMNRINEFEDGKSAYEVAVDNGYVGSEEEWLESLKGTDGTDGVNGVNGKDGLNGADGLSAYEIAVKNGFSGTEAEWLLSLKGADGTQGAKGDKGDKGDPGVDGSSITNVEISAGHLFVTICDADICNVLDLGRVVGTNGRNGTNGTNGSGYNGAAIDSNGDLIVTEVTGAGTERTVNLGHVVGADGADGQDYVLTAQDKDDIANIVLAEFTGSIVNGELNTR